ncbi:hypothetical protein HMPREF1608_00101 [Escherichia coli 908525]|nr:hypothetical protein HMPREF1608_00101 [Escherichia coli 908525]
MSNDPEEFGPEEHRQRKCAHPGPIFHICVEITQPVIAAVY